jgi:hypothetical protein
MKRLFVLMFAASLMVGIVSPAAAQSEKLSDEQLDDVTAAGSTVDVSDGVLRFDFKGKTASGHEVDAAGTVELLQSTRRPGTQNLIMTDNAQQDLQSFLNITAVNSLVQVLVNMNININSKVETLRQSNTLAEIRP